VAKKSSKHPEKFGTGVVDGIVASETANNASVGGALVPLLTMGIPGDTVTAMLLGGLMIHGLTPGPLLFTSSADIVYGIFAALIVANFIMLILEYYGIRLFVRLLRIPKMYLLPVIIASASSVRSV
jgi:putative tricarboxylic transport membrane protein